MKKLKDIKTIAVVGAGTMGQGIAQLCATKGFKTILFDLQEQAIENAKKGIIQLLDKSVAAVKISETEKEQCIQNILFTTNFSLVVGDLIIEAIVEKLEVKQKLFSDLSIQNDPDTVFATNTSSIPVTQIARKLNHKENLAGMHFFNPVHHMKLVEIISGANTDPAISKLLFDFAVLLGKAPVYAKDSPGFIVNRVARHYYVEGLKLLEENVASFESIDRQMESLGFKMGPFRLMDLIGIDTNFSVTSSMFHSFHHDSKFRPSRIQQQKVDAGFLGKKSGKGFYEY